MTAGRSAAARYGLAAAMALAAILATLVVHEAGDSSPFYAPLIGAVAVTVWYGGLGPGLVLVAITWTAVPLVTGRLGTDLEGAELARWAVALGVGLVVVVTGEALRHGRRRASTVAAVAAEDVRRLESLNAVAAALATSVSSADVASALTAYGPKLIAADGAVVGLVDGDELVLEEPSGLARSVTVAADRLRLERATVLTQAVRDETLVRADDRGELEASYPDSAALMPTARSAVAVPLRAAGEVVGVLGFAFEREHAVGGDEVAFVTTMAGLAEQALERARLYERERDTRRALDRILEVAPSFHADTTDDVAGAICHEARTTFEADYGLLWRIRDDRLELLAVDPPHPSVSVGGEWPLEDFPGLQRAVVGLSISFVPDVLVEASGRGRELVQELGTRSSLRTPIIVSGRPELVLSLAWMHVISEPDRSTLAIVRRFADQAALALEELERRRAEADAARRADETRRLQEVTSALSLAATPLDVSNTCLEHAVRTVGADAGFVVIAGPQGASVELVTSSGLSDEEASAWGSHTLEANVPFARAIASGEPVWALAAEEMKAFTAVAASGDGGWVALPLKTPAGVYGALHLSFSEPRELSQAEREWLQSLVSQCAQAFERSRLFDEEQLLRSRAERAQSLTAALSNALTRADVAEVAVGHIVASVEADGAVLAVVTEERALRIVARQGFGREDVEPWGELSGDEDTPWTRALAARKPALHVSRESLLAEFDDLAPELLPEGHECFLFVPLVAGRRANGLLTLSWTAPPRLQPEELRYVEALAGQAAQALDRAMLFESEQTIAETLQRSVLPVSLPRVDGLQLAARYLPGTAELDVGGDWFDAMQLPDGRIGLVVGDVVGKGVYAAASMGQLRNALRAFSVDRLKPATVLARLNRLAEEALETAFATIAYVVVDPDNGVCRISSAGHPPPVIAYPDGRVELLEGGRGLPLGTGVDVRYRQEVVALPAGTTLLLYTDGLVERRGVSIDDGLDRLREAVADGLAAPPERLLDHVLERMVGSGERGDDIALLAARLLPVAPRELDLRVSGGLGSLDLVRDALRTWLAGAEVTRAESEEIVLAAWEACANAGEHAAGASDARIRLRASLNGDSVRIVIEDSGPWKTPAYRPDRGLGLRLMRSVMSSVDVAAGEDGTRVTIEKTIGGR